MQPSRSSARAVREHMAKLGEDGLPPFPPPRPWPEISPEIAGGELWVFGYGSLMWHPGFPHQESCVSRLHGYNRDLCVWSWVYRGTLNAPGLVLGLDRGGSCIGVAYRVPDRHKRAAVAYLYRRELTTGIYRPLRKLVTLGDGRSVRALTFVVDRRQDQYAGRLPFDRVVGIVRSARGQRGRNAEYVLNTVRHLDELGIPCRRLERLARTIDTAVTR